MITETLGSIVADHLAALAENTVVDAGSTVWRLQQSLTQDNAIVLVELDRGSGKPTGQRRRATVSVAFAVQWIENPDPADTPDLREPA